MVNLSQPTSFQTAALAALDAVEKGSALNRAEQDLGGPSGSTSARNGTSSASRSRLVAPGDSFEVEEEGEI